MFAKMNTAQHRSMGYEAMESKEYKDAFKHYDAAILKYPEHHPDSELAKADLESLKKKKELALRFSK